MTFEMTKYSFLAKFFLEVRIVTLNLRCYLMVVFCLISPNFATCCLALNKHLVIVVFKKLSNFMSLALSTLAPMFSTEFLKKKFYGYILNICSKHWFMSNPSNTEGLFKTQCHDFLALSKLLANGLAESFEPTFSFLPIRHRPKMPKTFLKIHVLVFEHIFLHQCELHDFHDGIVRQFFTSGELFKRNIWEFHLCVGLLAVHKGQKMLSFSTFLNVQVPKSG